MKNRNIILKEIQEELYYDKDTGNFYWMFPKQGRPQERPAGSYSIRGYHSISYQGGRIYGAKLAWYLMTDEWPTFLIGYKDDNPRNLRWNNLKRITQAERVAQYRRTGRKLDEKNKPEPVSKPSKRAAFKEDDLKIAIEEYVRKQLNQTSL